MFKKVAALFLALCISCTALTGCLSSQTSPAEPPQVQDDSSKTDTPTSSGEKTVIRISFGSSEAHPVVETLKSFKEEFEARTDGRYDIQIFPNAVLGDDLNATEQLRANMLEAVVTSPSPLGGIVPELMAFDLPYIFKSEEEADQVLSGPFAAYLDKCMEEKGLINLAWYEDGFRHLTNSKLPVTSPDDLKGLKIRTMENPIHLAAWKALGANPTPMAYSDVFTALQQKVIDGQENPFPTIYDGKFYEVQDYCTTTGHVYSPMIFLYSGGLFEKLPEEDQQILKECAKATEGLNRELNRKAAEENRAFMEEQGMEIIDLTMEQKQVFQDMLTPVWSEFTDIFGEDTLALLQEELAKL